MNSFIPWVGGKSQLRKNILSEFPDKPLKRYVEVFGGAGWILFSKDKHADVEFINDRDSQLINLYRCIKYHMAELQHELMITADGALLNSREIFEDFKEQVNTRGLTDIQRAARYFYLIRISYGAKKDNFGCNKKVLINAIERLPEIQARLQDVVIENLDFERMIKNYNKESTLFYLDPPYYNAEQFYQGFENGDHERLFKSIATIKDMFILSYNDTPEIRALYKDYNILELERANNLVTRTGAQKPKYKELIIKNF